MIKRMIATVALGLLLATPVQGAEVKSYDQLTDLQKETLQYAAIAKADPSYLGAMFYEQGIETVKQSQPKQNTRFYHTFAECASEEMVAYFLSLSPLKVMNTTDALIEQSLADFGFDVGVMCMFEAQEDQKATRWN